MTIVDFKHSAPNLKLAVKNIEEYYSRAINLFRRLIRSSYLQEDQPPYLPEKDDERCSLLMLT
ncbi:MAG: hypothetical protein QW828_03260 [Candidatus Bathyarchaeia archaeon]